MVQKVKILDFRLSSSKCIVGDEALPDDKVLEYYTKCYKKHQALEDRYDKLYEKLELFDENCPEFSGESDLNSNNDGMSDVYDDEVSDRASNCDLPGDEDDTMVNDEEGTASETDLPVTSPNSPRPGPSKKVTTNKEDKENKEHSEQFKLDHKSLFEQDVIKIDKLDKLFEEKPEIIPEKVVVKISTKLKQFQKILSSEDDPAFEDFVKYFDRYCEPFIVKERKNSGDQNQNQQDQNQNQAEPKKEPDNNNDKEKDSSKIEDFKIQKWARDVYDSLIRKYKKLREEMSEQQLKLICASNEDPQDIPFKNFFGEKTKEDASASILNDLRNLKEKDGDQSDDSDTDDELESETTDDEDDFVEPVRSPINKKEGQTVLTSKNSKNSSNGNNNASQKPKISTELPGKTSSDDEVPLASIKSKMTMISKTTTTPNSTSNLASKSTTNHVTFKSGTKTTSTGGNNTKKLTSKNSSNNSSIANKNDVVIIDNGNSSSDENLSLATVKKKMESSGSIKKYRKPDIITKPSEPILIISSDEDEDMNLNDLKGKLKEKEKTSNKPPKKPSNVIELTEEENKMMLAINHLKKLGRLKPEMTKKLEGNSVYRNLNKKITKFQQDHGKTNFFQKPIFKVIDGPKNQTQKDSKKEAAKKSEQSQSQTTSKSSTNQAPTSQKRKIEVPDTTNKQLKVQANDKVCSNKKDPTPPNSKKIEEEKEEKIDYENEIKALKKEKSQLEKDIKKWFWGL